MAWHIQVDGTGNATGHINLPDDARPLTEARGDKPWFKPATLTKPTPAEYQTRSGPVYDISNGTITYTVADFSVADARAAKKEELAALRYDKEIAGITVNSAPIQTDRDSQAKLIAIRILAKEDANYTVKWKAASGFVTLNAAAVIAVADAVGTHVQDCFDNEGSHSVAIDALTTVAAVRSYDISTGWPS